MIFRHTYRWVVGESPYTLAPKTATSRMVKPGDFLLNSVVYRESGIPRYAVGEVHAVQPGRGEHAVGFVRIKSIERTTPHRFTPEQIHNEGLSDSRAFIGLWRGIHGELSEYADVWHITFEWVGVKRPPREER